MFARASSPASSVLRASLSSAFARRSAAPAESFCRKRTEASSTIARAFPGAPLSARSKKSAATASSPRSRATAPRTSRRRGEAPRLQSPRAFHPLHHPPRLVPVTTDLAVLNLQLGGCEHEEGLHLLVVG